GSGALKLIERELRTLLRRLGGTQADIDPNRLDRASTRNGTDVAGTRPGRNEFSAGASKLFPSKERSGAACPERRCRLRSRRLEQSSVLAGRSVEDAQRDPEEDVTGKRPEQ